MSNRTFCKALHLLSRPVSLGAIALLLVNDHLLRQFWPSWLTGKLGDFAWLFFSPFVVAALVAWLIPPRLARQEQIAGWLAFGLTGGVFALAKTVPAFHAGLVQGGEALLGMPISVTRDPTDLLALISLLASWRLWQRPTLDVPSFSVPGWVALPLAALLTVANSAAPDYGIYCLTVQNGQIIAHTTFESYASTDGGLSWQRSEANRYESACAETASLSDKDWPGIDWQPPPDLSLASQAERAYIEKSHGGNVHYRPGPLDVETDSRTGNTIYAMGHEGILVQTVSDEWIWVAVGDYSRVSLSQPGAILTLLMGEGALAVGLGLLCLCTLSLRLSRHWLKLVPLLLLWGLWGSGVILLPPALTTGYLEMLVWMLLATFTVLALVLAASSVYQIARRSRSALARIAAVALSGALLFFLPYLLWALDGLPGYSAAVLFALVLGAGTLLLGDRWTRPLLASVQALPAPDALARAPSDPAG